MDPLRGARGVAAVEELLEGGLWFGGGAVGIGRVRGCPAAEVVAAAWDVVVGDVRGGAEMLGIALLFLGGLVVG